MQTLTTTLCLWWTIFNGRSLIRLKLLCKYHLEEGLFNFGGPDLGNLLMHEVICSLFLTQFLYFFFRKQVWPLDKLCVAGPQTCSYGQMLCLHVIPNKPVVCRDLFYTAKPVYTRLLGQGRCLREEKQSNGKQKIGANCPRGGPGQKRLL